MWVWLKLTIMKLASRKNMISISGMISMRARFFGIGEETRILIRRARHRKRDRYFNFCHTSWFESPPPKRAHGGIIKNGIANTLGHGRVRDVSAAHIDRDHANATASDVTASGFIGIFRPGSADCARLGLRGCRHAGGTRWTGNLRSFDRCGWNIRVISRRRFLMESDRHRDAVHRNGPAECGD